MMQGLYLWEGVVEDRDDPLELGRVRVRIVGLHSEKLVPDDKTGEGIPVASLPWAHPVCPITNANMHGIGETPLGPVEGTWVVGYSRDGSALQNLVYFGTLPGIVPEQTEEGFGDPNKKYPKQDYKGEPDTNRLARGVTEGTIVPGKKSGTDKNVPTSTGGQWSEPETPYAAKYPFNHVHESESGHIFEVDDTEGAERIHDYHRAGTFREVHPDGTEVHKIVKDSYEIVAGKKNVHIKGECNITISGNCNLKVIGNVTEETPLHTIKGRLHVTQNISTDASVQAADQVNDANGTMQEMRDTYNGHDHIGNLGVPVSAPNQQQT